MGRVLFSVNIIDSFKNQVHDYFYGVTREIEKAESALNFCVGEINSQIEEAERMRSDAYSDYDLAWIISDRNYSKISSLKSQLSSLGTGEENAAQRKALQSKISGAESYNRALDGLKNRIKSIEKSTNSMRVDRLWKALIPRCVPKAKPFLESWKK